MFVTQEQAYGDIYRLLVSTANIFNKSNSG